MTSAAGVTSRAPRPSSNATKNGTPISAVTSPIGMSTPGMIALLAIDASDRTQRAGERARRQEEAMVLADQHARDVRADQADERDRAHEGHRRRREQADAQQRHELHPGHVDAEAAGPILAEPERRELPGSGERERHDHGDDTPPAGRPGPSWRATGCPSSRTRAAGAPVRWRRTGSPTTSALNVKNSAIPNRTRVSLPPSRDRTTLCSSSTEPNANTKALAETIQLAGTPGNADVRARWPAPRRRSRPTTCRA